jgi:para-aminobenzoate synthetase
MRTLIIDNYDSFTYNLYHLFAVVNQEEPIVIYNDEIAWAELSSWHFDNIVISPGPGRPERSADFGVCRDAICNARVPLLGVCLGHQGITALHGGKIVRAPEPVHGKASFIIHDGTGLFAGIPSPVAAGRYHSLIATRPLPQCLRETARTADGLVMSLQHRDRPLWGLQFHPESILTEHGRRLAENFRDLTRRHSGRRAIAPAPATPRRHTSTRSGRRALWREIRRPVNTEHTFVTLFGDCPSAFWFDSSHLEAGRSRWSFLGTSSLSEAGLVEYNVGDAGVRVGHAHQRHIERTGIFEYLADMTKAPVAAPPPCPFTGGYVGWFGYELRNEVGTRPSRQAETPDALFMDVDRFIAVDHVAGRTYVVAIACAETAATAQRWIDDIAEALPDAVDRTQETDFKPKYSNPAPLRFRLHRDRDTYLHDVERCLDWIRQGESYQICLTNEISCAIDVDPLVLYQVMRRINPAPYSAFLRWPGGAVLSSSPERFMAVDTDRRVETKPIKGTIARDRDPVLDRQLADMLLSSEKDRAENAMIVDLLRNDLSRTCIPGSVLVPELNALESYATVHQLVSTVQGTLRPDQSVLDLIRACFPGGSMTGAPKTRTMEFIDELERRPRGVYSGALGWIGHGGQCDLSIVIRAIVAVNGRLTIGCGGGVVAQSTPEGEFEEMLLKAHAPIRAIVTAATGGFDAERYIIEGARAEAGRHSIRAEPSLS